MEFSQPISANRAKIALERMRGPYTPPAGVPLGAALDKGAAPVKRMTVAEKAESERVDEEARVAAAAAAAAGTGDAPPPPTEAAMEVAEETIEEVKGEEVVPVKAEEPASVEESVMEEAPEPVKEEFAEVVKEEADEAVKMGADLPAAGEAVEGETKQVSNYSLALLSP